MSVLRVGMERRESRTCTSSQLSRNRAADLDIWICSASVHSMPSGEDVGGRGMSQECMPPHGGVSAGPTHPASHAPPLTMFL